MDLEEVKAHRGRAILRFAVPSIAAMVLTALVNVVDGYFIGNYVGKEGLAAVNLGLPIVYLYLAVGLMIAVRGVSIAGRLLGAGHAEEANGVFRQTAALSLLVTAALTVCLLPILGALARAFGADAVTAEHFVRYYGVLLFELPLMVLISALGMFIRAEGAPVFVMLLNLVTVALNALLDALFVGPLDMGVAGVAAASVCAAAAVVALAAAYFFRRANVFRFGRFRFCGAVLKETLLNGGSEFIGELSMCISMAAYNYVVLRIAGVDGLAAFTIIGYVSYVFSMVIVGFGQGIVPIVSFAFGAGQRALAAAVRNTTLKYVVGAAAAFFAVMSLCAGQYSGIFSPSAAVTALVLPGLRLQMSSFAFAGVNTIVSFYFTAIGKAKESAVISASRGLVVLLAAICLLPALFGVTGVWLVSLTTEAVTLALTARYLAKERAVAGRRSPAEI